MKYRLGNLPTLQSSIRFIHPHHVIISKGKGLYDEEKIEDDDDSDSEDDFCNDDVEEVNVYVYYSHKNERFSHMLGTAKTKVRPFAIVQEIGNLIAIAGITPIE